MGLGDPLGALLPHLAQPRDRDALHVDIAQAAQVEHPARAREHRVLVQRAAQRRGEVAQVVVAAAGPEGRPGRAGAAVSADARDADHGAEVVADGHVARGQVLLVAAGLARRVLEELDVDDAREADAVVGPEGVGIVADVPEALGDAGVFEDGFEGLAGVGGGGDGGIAEGEDVYDLDLLKLVDEDCDQRDGAVAAEVVAFDVYVEGGAGRNGGEELAELPAGGNQAGGEDCHLEATCILRYQRWVC